MRWTQLAMEMSLTAERMPQDFIVNVECSEIEVFISVLKNTSETAVISRRSKLYINQILNKIKRINLWPSLNAKQVRTSQEFGVTKPTVHRPCLCV